MPKGDACFYCKRSINGKILNLEDPTLVGWSFDCSLGLENENLNGGPEIAAACPQFDPRFGFQMGGYYTHMWFEEDGQCLAWIIQGDGNFPISDDDTERMKDRLEFHICDFEQIEKFVEFWGKELRKQGLI